MALRLRGLDWAAMEQISSTTEPMLSMTSAIPLADAAMRRAPSAAFNSTDSDTLAYRPRMR